jgi:hypothetical protein
VKIMLSLNQSLELHDTFKVAILFEYVLKKGKAIPVTGRGGP